ncbi:unnamed protein product [Cladocopium goreaui]|uniref:AB hydrolase-1 domain-containing protein n=1 Tax=Cladocopium goreaui TaxID=2562237 RepID=A0A9P1CQL9_9DINO|nr:unnamed protein product [Cladocopium goreaui]
MPPKLPEGKYCELPQQGVKLYYEIQGPLRRDFQGEKEEVLFLLMGSVADLRKTTDQQFVNAGLGMFKVFTFDHRNTGRSSIKDEPCSMEDYADDAAALLEAVMPQRLPVCVMGVSFGAMVAQHMALRHPKLIKRLVLCCGPSGGDGGMSYPIHEWYSPGVSMEDRVTRRIFQANRSRDAAWKQRCKSEWEMVYTLLMRDEKVGLDEPLRAEGIHRQLEARKQHDVWARLPELQIETLVCGSPEDNITPVELLEKLAARIGCEKKLDFEGGHAFAAADAKCLPFINDWLRRPSVSAETSNGHSVLWKVIGGADKGGIIVRSGPGLTDELAKERLTTGALVEEVESRGDRIRYRLQQGTGPREGWVTVRLAGGKELLSRA